MQNTTENNGKTITEYLILKGFPETKKVTNRDGNETYRFDCLVGTKIPKSTQTPKSSIRKVELKFSPNSNIPGVQTTALDATKLIAENKESLTRGEMFAKVVCYMSPKTNKQGVIDAYVPYINKVELIKVDENTKPYVDLALSADEKEVY